MAYFCKSGLISAIGIIIIKCMGTIEQYIERQTPKTKKYKRYLQKLKEKGIKYFTKKRK